MWVPDKTTWDSWWRRWTLDWLDKNNLPRTTSVTALM
jgi:hypothetical protein